MNQGSGQSSGYVLYETMIISGGLLTTKGHLQDRGQVGHNGWAPVALLCEWNPVLLLKGVSQW